MDPRMGTMDKFFKCKTRRTLGSPGHFGAIELEKPAFHIGHFAAGRRPAVHCFYCSKVLLDESDPRYIEAQRIHRLEVRFAHAGGVPDEECK